MTTIAVSYALPSGTPRPVEYDNGGTSAESSIVRDRYRKLREYVLAAFSAFRANTEASFLSLKVQWETETAMFSSVAQIAMHPAYQQIIGLGKPAVPLILSEMQQKPGHWFWALRSITGEDPVRPEKRGRIAAMTKAWLDWGRERGYVR